MAIPIRLLAGINSDIQVDLIAQSIDIAVDRGASAFPTPNNILQRFAIDTNIPSIKVEVNGILVDDEGVDIGDVSTTEPILSSTPMRTAINFGAMFPNNAYNNFLSSKGTRNVLRENYGETTSFSFSTTQNVRKSSTNSIVKLTIPSGSNYSVKNWTGQQEILTRLQVGLKFTGAHIVGTTGPLTVASALSSGGTAITISANNEQDYGPNYRLRKGDRVVKSDGTFLGVVNTTTLNTVTFDDPLINAISTNDELYINSQCFNHRNEFVGYVDSVFDDTTVAQGDTAIWTVTLVGSNQNEILNGTQISINSNSSRQLETLLQNTFLKFIPSYWLEDVSKSPYGQRFPNGDIQSIRLEFDTVTIYTTAPSITYLANRFRNRGQIGIIHSKFYDAIINVPIGNVFTTVGVNPAVEIAEQVKAALTLSGNISYLGVNEAGGKTLADAFTVTRSGPVVIVEQNYIPDISLEHPNPLSQSLIDNFETQVFQSQNASSSASRKSAGDKVQDLVGLVSNADKSVDLFRGIQIPYDSLITSSGLTGVARNFFLTFGEIDPQEKGSVANTRAASALMNEFLFDADGNTNPNEDGKKNVLDKLLDKEIVDDVQSLVGFLVQGVKDVFITLGTGAHGNDGGIRIIPEKLHVRYDAGNNYYAYSLVLLASDFVIGV